MYDGGQVVATNEGWSTGMDSSVVSQRQTAMAAVGAFPLPVGSPDSALFPSVSGVRTFIIEGNGTTGTALGEIYDATTGLGAVTSTSQSRLVNISARGQVNGGDPLIDGFVIVGAPRTLLIRAVGPTLVSQGVGGVVQNTLLTLYDSQGRAMSQTNGWHGDPAVANIAKTVGAFPLPNESGDSVLLVTLPAGLYTAMVTTSDGSSGVALCEIYEVP